MWRSLVGKEFLEAVLASCQFGSIHQKEFRLLVFLLSAERLEVKCPGGHAHVPIQGRSTKPSATYVKDLAHHIALEFLRTLEWQSRNQDDDQPAVRLESVLSHDVLLSSTWTLLSHHHWKLKKHINVFETDMALQVLRHQCRFETETKFVSFLDSQVGRSFFGQRKEQFVFSCTSLPQVCRSPDRRRDLSWVNFSPTRQNPADDPTSGVKVRAPLELSIISDSSIDFASLHAHPLPRAYANWVRLLILLSLCQPAFGLSVDFSLDFSLLDFALSLILFLDFPSATLSLWICSALPCWLFHPLSVVLSLSLATTVCS